MRSGFVIGGMALVLGGCGSFAGDMKMMCDAPKHVEGLEHMNPAERAQAISLYITEHTKNGETRKFFQGLATVPQEKRGELLDDAVRKAGIDPAECEMLEDWR